MADQAPPAVSIHQEEGFGPKTLLWTAFVAMIVGGVLSGLAIQSCMHTPAELAASRAEYEIRVDSLEATVRIERNAGAAAAVEANRRKQNEERLRQEIATLELARPDVLEGRPVDPLPVKVMERTPPLAAARLRFFEAVFAPQVREYAKALETALGLERARNVELSAALSDMTVAYERASAALAASEQAHAESKQRLADWERVSIPKRKALIIVGGTALAMIVAGKVIGD